MWSKGTDRKLRHEVKPANTWYAANQVCGSMGEKWHLASLSEMHILRTIGLNAGLYYWTSEWGAAAAFTFRLSDAAIDIAAAGAIVPFYCVQ